MCSDYCSKVLRKIDFCSRNERNFVFPLLFRQDASHKNSFGGEQRNLCTRLEGEVINRRFVTRRKRKCQGYSWIGDFPSPSPALERNPIPSPSVTFPKLVPLSSKRKRSARVPPAPNKHRQIKVEVYCSCTQRRFAEIVLIPPKALSVHREALELITNIHKKLVG